jgi:hypothetical protein
VINEDAPVIFGISYCYNLLAIIPDIASAVITTTYFAVGMTTMPAVSMVHDIDNIIYYFGIVHGPGSSIMVEVAGSDGETEHHRHQQPDTPTIVDLPTPAHDATIRPTPAK